MRHASRQRVRELLAERYPRRGLEPAARNPHPQQDCLQPTQPHYLRLWGQGLRTPVLFVPRYVVLLD